MLKKDFTFVVFLFIICFIGQFVQVSFDNVEVVESLLHYSIYYC